MSNNETIQKTIQFGKVDYYGNGRKSCPVEVEVNYRDGRLSIMGAVWNPRRSDWRTGGQCQETLLKLLPHNKKLQEVVEVWNRWHLNDMNAACEHQRELGWREQGKIPLWKWKLSLTTIARNSRDTIEAGVLREVCETRQVEISEEERTLLSLPMSQTIYTHDAETPEVPEFYEIGKHGWTGNPERTARGWVTHSKHSDGLLSKPCPVCGYKYGSAWQFEEVPESVLEVIRAW